MVLSQRVKMVLSQRVKMVLSQRVTPVAFGTAITLYGACLLAYGSSFPNQVQLMIVMRATGFNKIEEAISETRRNIREAARSAIFRAPSLVMGAKSISDLQDRMKAQKQIIDETNQAKQDGIVTVAEHRKIKRLRKKQLNAIKKDIKRMKRASSSLDRVLKTLNFDEILDIVKSFMFIMTAVLANGHSESMISNILSRYFHFLNLGSLLLEINRKVNFPLSHLLLERRFSVEHIDDEDVTFVKILGATLVYTVSAYLTIFRNALSNLMNLAFMASAITLRGLSILSNIYDKDDRVGKQLRGRVGGMLAILLAFVGIFCRNLVKDGILDMPSWAHPLSIVEEFVKKIVGLAETYS
mmetsp:Transcript_60260/g.89385  ORF Transcript_60260/g.89385 Transcript_60260/m.89385 type:complete len:354 (-) Transcript_60260:79-1140(-)